MDSSITFTLQDSVLADLEHFFRIQQDADGIFMAAFTPKDPNNKSEYLHKYAKLLQEPTVNMKTIIVDEQIAGSISKFEIDGVAEITYWIDRPYWGKGIGTFALKSLLSLEPVRPIYGRVASDNIGSQRVLEKCGFLKVGTDRGFANARQEEIEEFIYCLSK